MCSLKVVQMFLSLRKEDGTSGVHSTALSGSHQTLPLPPQTPTHLIKVTTSNCPQAPHVPPGH